jgi:hypothetical protein
MQAPHRQQQQHQVACGSQPAVPWPTGSASSSTSNSSSTPNSGRLRSREHLLMQHNRQLLVLQMLL